MALWGVKGEDRVVGDEKGCGRGVWDGGNLRCGNEWRETAREMDERENRVEVSKVGLGACKSRG